MSYFVIDPKYRTLLKGEYNPGVYTCPHCGNNMIKTRYANIVGFANSKIGEVAITQCDKCFEYYYCHAYKEDYEIFLDMVQMGKIKTFRKDDLGTE